MADSGTHLWLYKALVYMDAGTAIELVLWTIVAILGGFIVYRVKKIGPFKPTIMELPPQPKKAVEMRDFTPAELKEFDGSDASKPILFSVQVSEDEKLVQTRTTGIFRYSSFFSIVLAH